MNLITSEEVQIARDEVMTNFLRDLEEAHKIEQQIAEFFTVNKEDSK